MAAETDQPVQVLDDTTKDTIVYAQPDGSFTAELASGPVREPDPTDPTGFTPIDLTLEQGPDGLQPAVADADITFSSGGTGTMASIAQDDTTLAFDATSSLPAPTVEGSTATYANVQPNVDLVLAARVSGYEQSYVVKAPPSGPLTLYLPLALDGLSATVAEDGSLLVTDDNGDPVAQATPPIIYGDETDPVSGEPVDQMVVDTAIVVGANGPVLQVSPDPEFFSTPGLEYPVVIDPAPDFSVATDTYVKSTSANTSFATSSTMKVGTPDGTEIDRTLISFSGLDVLDDTHVLSATLSLYENDSASCTASEIDLYNATSSFDSSTTWNTGQPSAGTLYASASAAHGHSSSCPNA